MFSNSFPAFADGPYTLPDLPYPYEALEPYIDAATMKVLQDASVAHRPIDLTGAHFVFDEPIILTDLGRCSYCDAWYG